MDVCGLKAFLTLCEQLHFGRAASAANVSPSTLSRLIQRLERELGVRLFERNNRGVRLSGHGAVLRSQARELMTRLEVLQQSLQSERDGLHGAVSLYCTVTASYSLLAQLLPEFRARHPGVEIKVHTGDESAALTRVSQGLDDLAIAARPDRLPRQLAFLELATTPLVFIAPGGAAEQDLLRGPMMAERSRDVWGALPMILPETGQARLRIDRWFAGFGLEPSVYAQVGGHEAIVGMVALGCGYGVVPALVLGSSPFRDGVRILDVRPELPPFRIGLCCRATSLKNPLVAALWKLAAARAESA